MSEPPHTTATGDGTDGEAQGAAGTDHSAGAPGPDAATGPTAAPTPGTTARAGPRRATTPRRTTTASPRRVTAASKSGSTGTGPSQAPSRSARTARTVPASAPAPAPASHATTAPRPGRPRPPLTLAIDIGGTGLKASVLDATGAMVADRVAVKTTYPCSPATMVDDLVALVAPLPPADRISAGFPGMVRTGRILSAPHFVTLHGPGTTNDPQLVKQWSGFDLAGALSARLGKPARVANDADVQGAAVVKGTGLELVVTLGTGVGTAFFYEGRLLPHLEFAHHPFLKGDTYNEQIGDSARKQVGNARWNKRVRKAVTTLRNLSFFDHCFIGGGNAKKLHGDLGDDVSLVDNSAGILGGIRLWDESHIGV
ncbi:MAG: ROK family protein [Acidimicrobiales bacterium]|jgi:polyphosphate glucokinase